MTGTEHKKLHYKGRKLPESTKQKISKSLTGKKQTEETIRKRVEAIKGRKNPNAVAAMQKARLGSHNSEVANESNRLAHLGNKIWLGRHHTDESKGKISKTRKQLGCGIGNKNALGNKGHTGLKWITDEVDEKTISGEQLPPKGWKFGRRPFRINKPRHEKPLDRK